MLIGCGWRIQWRDDDEEDDDDDKLMNNQDEQFELSDWVELKEESEKRNTYWKVFDVVIFISLIAYNT